MDRRLILAVAKKLADAHISPPSDCYLEITEGRQNWQKPDGTIGKYSWCGDYVTYVLTQSGATNGRGLNRVSINGVWRVGENISMLLNEARRQGLAYEGIKAISRLRDPGARGDVIIIASPQGGHVGILDRYVSEFTYATYDGNSVGGVTTRNLRDLRTKPPYAVLDSSAYFESLSLPTTPTAVTEAIETQMERYANTFALAGDASDDYFNESETA